MKKKLLLIGLVLIMAFAMTACGTDSANTGDDKADGNGDNAQAETTGLEAVEVIGAQWLKSGHANVSEPLSYAGVRGRCGVCHSGNALERFGTEDPYAAKGIAENEGDETFAYKFDPHEAELPSPIGCATCHSAAGGEILETGVIPADLTVNGAEMNVGNSNALCYTCHNARRDVDKMYESWTTEGAERENQYPHHGWGSLVTLAGMEYPEIEYPSSSKHVELGCVGCHMPEKDGTVSHEFKPDIATCQKCHSDATEFTLGGGLEKELTDKLAKLEELVLAEVPGAVGIGAAHGKTPVYDKDGKAISNADLPVEVLVGAYNWAIVSQDLEAGKGVHNPKYAKALLDESIKKLEELK